MSPEIKRLIERSKDLEAVGLQRGAATLPNHSNVEVTRAGQLREGQRVSDNSARRLDAFSALKDGMAKGAYDAARRLQKDILLARCEGDRGRPLERVDCDAGKEREFKFIAAAAKVRCVKERLSSRDWWLLVELIAPAVHRGSWRDHVTYITHETHVHAQAAAVRAACVNLRDAYAALEKRAA
jgi:hypothetical protein